MYPNLDDFIELLSRKEITEHNDLSKYDEETIADYNLLISQARRARVGYNKSTLKVKQLRELQVSYNVTIEIKLDEVVSVFNDLSKEVRSLDSTQTFPSQQLDIISKLNSLILFFHKEMDNFSIKPLEKTDASNKSITLIDALFSKYNILLLGDAGSGKTTNLQVHAKRLYESNYDGIVIYSTLNEICKLQLNLSSEQDKYCLFGLLAKFLINLGIRKSVNELEYSLKNQKCVIILDSVDEAISSFPWVIKSMIDLSNGLSQGKIITSSRYTVEEISELGFLSLSLCPFNREQKSQFFKKWFDCSLGAESIMKHLAENPKLDDVVTNPLSATILATLQQHKIPLPSTEASLYKKRFELLTGLFDRFKGVHRSKLSPELLLEAAQYLAFEFHRKLKREFTRDLAIDCLNNSDIYLDQDENTHIIDELMSPCEIIQPSAEKLFSFGHLRFQEYLASREIQIRRDLILHKLLLSNWWHDVFYLFAQDARGIDWLVEDAISNDYSTEAKDILMLLISLRSEGEINKLNRKLRIALAREAKEKGFNDTQSEFEEINEYEDINEYDEFDELN